MYQERNFSLKPVYVLKITQLILIHFYALDITEPVRYQRLRHRNGIFFLNIFGFVISKTKM